MTRTEYQCIDPFVLLDAVGAELEAFRSLAATFLEIAPPMLDRLERALAAADLRVIAHESHSLKSTCLLVGAARLSALLKDIEGQARRAQAPVAETVLPELAQLFLAAATEVQYSITHFHGKAG